MAIRIDRNFADAFSTALDETDEWQAEINLRELVEDSFFSIEKAREKKATWEQITSVLQKLVGTEVEIKVDTVRQYYFDAIVKKDELAEKQKQKAKKARAKKRLSSQNKAATVNSKQSNRHVSAEVSTEDSRNGSGEAESAFSLRPKREKVE